MIKEYEGKTEKEAIDRAVSDLSIDREEFDVEIVESTRKGIFKKGTVRIRVHVSDEDLQETETTFTEKESMVVRYLEELLSKMGYPGKVDTLYKENGKIGLGITSPDRKSVV